MDRKLFGVFSGAHVVIMFCTTLLTPAVLYGAVAYSNVALVNPTTGNVAYVDGAGRLSVDDLYASYRNFPGNQVDIAVKNNGNGCETAEQYTLPSGKAFIITAISGFETQYNSGYNFSGVDIYSGVSCSGNQLTTHVSPVSTTSPAAPISVDYGSGIPVPAGSSISVSSDYNYGRIYIHGYLVPASTVPTSSYHG